jgi:peptidoglycan-associated lipoprotein
MRIRSFVLILLVALIVTACARRQPPVARPMPPPAAPPATASVPPPVPPPEPVNEPLPVPAQPLADESISNRSLDDLNRDSPLQPVFFALDSSDLDDAGRAVVTANAALLRRNPTWVIMVEGHCDERGTAEYNLALGERRAVAVRAYLVSLGIPPGRVTTVSYGNEFPFDPGHDEGAWSRNRRAHFVITSK